MGDNPFSDNPFAVSSSNVRVKDLSFPSPRAIRSQTLVKSSFFYSYLQSFTINFPTPFKIARRRMEQPVALEARGLEARQVLGATPQTPPLPHLHQHLDGNLQHLGVKVRVVGARKLICLVERQN